MKCNADERYRRGLDRAEHLSAHRADASESRRECKVKSASSLPSEAVGRGKPTVQRHLEHFPVYICYDTSKIQNRR